MGGGGGGGGGGGEGKGKAINLLLLLYRETVYVNVLINYLAHNSPLH